MSTVSATVSGQTVKYVQVWPENGPRQGGAGRSSAEQGGAVRSGSNSVVV